MFFTLTGKMAGLSIIWEEEEDDILQLDLPPEERQWGDEEEKEEATGTENDSPEDGPPGQVGGRDRCSLFSPGTTGGLIANTGGGRNRDAGKGARSDGSDHGGVDLGQRGEIVRGEKVEGEMDPNWGWYF